MTKAAQKHKRRTRRAPATKTARKAATDIHVSMPPAVNLSAGTPQIGTPTLRQRPRPEQTYRLRVAIAELYPGPRPTKEEVPNRVIRREIKDHFRKRGWKRCPCDKTMDRFLRREWGR